VVRTFILEVATKRNFFPGRLFGHPLRGEIISSASNIVSIGIDLGGTTFDIGWLTSTGQLEHVQEFETKSFRPRDEIVADLAAAISRTAQASRDAGLSVSSVGLGFPGVIDARSGVVILPPNFGEGWKNFALAKALSVATGISTHLINDARAFTFAEARLGAGKGATDLLGITLGTGVGGGLVLDGRLYIGKHCTAGEFGHQLFDPHGPTCGCGSPGCIEVYSSGPAIVSAATRPLRQGRTPMLREIINNDLNQLSPKAIAQAANAGELECQEIYAKVGRVLAWGIANLTHVLGPETVVIGGGVARAGEILFTPIREYLERDAKMVPNLPSIVPAQLGNHAGLIGAAVWAKEQAMSNER
jgi:glucokinase